MATIHCWRRIAGAAVLLALAGCSPRATMPPQPASQTVSGLTVQMTTPQTPHSGDNTLNLTLTDAATNMPVPDANVTCTPNMLAPRGTFEAVSGRSQGNGVYQVPVRLPIATRYELQFDITRRGGLPPVTVSFPLEATQ